MAEIPCQFPNCNFEADNGSEAIAIVMNNSHLISHQASTSQQQDGQVKQKLPPITRPTVKQDIDEEEWCTVLTFLQRASETSSFNAVREGWAGLLSKRIQQSYPKVNKNSSKQKKQMAVIHIATRLRPNIFLQSRQEAGESLREFYANVKAVASTCAFGRFWRLGPCRVRSCPC